MRTTSTRVAARLALLVGALFVTVLLAELLLQFGAWVVEGSGRAVPDGFQTDRRRVVAFGDSHTYGLYLTPEEAYPAQLETLWNERPGVPPIEVVNLGYPGTNSSVVAREFTDALESLAPDVAIVLIGVNDMWTEHVDPGPESDGWDRLIGRLRAHSRVLRFASILTTTDDPASPAPAGRRDEQIPRGWTGEVAAEDTVLKLGVEGMRQGSRGVDGPRLLANLKRLAREAERHDVELVLMTYPAAGKFYHFSNVVIREAAQQTGLRLVDLTAVFYARCPDKECASLLFPDKHPRPAGYALIAETLTNSIGDLLTQ